MFNHIRLTLRGSVYVGFPVNCLCDIYILLICC